MRDYDDHCRLWLGSIAHGDGSTLQEAADALIARLLTVSMSVRSSGFRVTSESGLADQQLMEFLRELGDLAARGADIRERVFGRPDIPDAAF